MAPPHSTSTGYCPVADGGSVTAVRAAPACQRQSCNRNGKRSMHWTWWISRTLCEFLAREDARFLLHCLAVIAEQFTRCRCTTQAPKLPPSCISDSGLCIGHRLEMQWSPVTDIVAAVRVIEWVSVPCVFSPALISYATLQAILSRKQVPSHVAATMSTSSCCMLLQNVARFVHNALKTEQWEEAVNLCGMAVGVWTTADAEVTQQRHIRPATSVNDQGCTLLHHTARLGSACSRVS